jgi:hypothetical protein
MDFDDSARRDLSGVKGFASDLLEKIELPRICDILTLAKFVIGMYTTFCLFS